MFSTIQVLLIVGLTIFADGPAHFWSSSTGKKCEPHKRDEFPLEKKSRELVLPPHAQMLAAAAACRAPVPALPGSGYLLGRIRVSKRRAPTRRGRSAVVRCGLLPVDPWAPTMDSQSIASQLFAVSLFPYLGFLYFMTKSKTAPGLTLFGFYFLLVFVGATSTRPPLLRSLV